MTQEEMAGVLGCSQSNVSFLDRGQTVRPDTARKLVETAVALGVQLSLEQVYGDAPLPPWRSIANSQQLDRRDWREVLQQLMARGWSAPLLAARYGVKVSLIVDLSRGVELDPPHSVGEALLRLHDGGSAPHNQHRKAV
jgi:hypothetical protein